MDPIAVDGYGMLDSATSAAQGFGVLQPGERFDAVLDKTTTTKGRADQSAANTITVELDTL